MSIVEIDAVVGIREELHIVIVDVSQVQLVKENKCVLEMDVVICVAMHDQESDILA